MVKVGDMVQVNSLQYTRIHCGRKSQYDVGDSFIVFNVSDCDERGIIVSDNDCNFVHQNDIKVISNV